MPTEIRMPALSSTMTEGALAKWLKKEGDEVRAGEAIAEIETDKAVVELEAAADGVLGRILIGEGGPAVKVNDLIAVLFAQGEPIPPAPALADGFVTAPSAAAVSAAAPLAESNGRVFASPLARRIARDGGISLFGIAGSGPHGRIIRSDIENALKSAPAPLPFATQAPVVAPAGAKDACNYDEIPHTPMRRVIAQRLTESKQSVPHFYLTIDCAIDELLALREQINSTRTEAKLSINDFIVKAAGVALRRVPSVNASWTENAVRRYRSVDISVAVATPSGLITPVVNDVDLKTLSAIAGQIRELAARARENRLKPHEYQGGGLTISNLGMHGVQQFTAIINPPQACILSVGAGQMRPVVKAGALAVATMMTCTLSVDHRVVDGAVGAEFLAVFKALIEQPLGMLV